MSDYTEQEQLAIARQWLKDNGKYFIGTIGFILVFYSGWSFYQNYQQSNIESAAEIYNEFDAALEGIIVQSSSAREKMDAAAQILATMQKNYASNGRSLLATLKLAGLEAELNNLNTAKTYLLWAREHALDAGFESIINYRLATIALSQKQYADALQLLSNPAKGFDAMYAELEGDIQLIQNSYDGAVNAYKRALKTIDDTGKPLIEIKLQQAQALTGSDTSS